MTDFARRTFLITSTLGAAAVLSGCMEDAPAVLSVSAQGGAGMNPGPGGADRPVTITVLQLASAAAFDAADYFALQNPSAALGGDLIRSDQLVLAPGGSASKAITIQPGTSVIGVVGGFRDPAGRTVRSKIAAPGGNSGLIINVGSGGLSLARV
ncbi:type VI secretion system lipoprotein TssJ [Sulfitobacter sp. HNIBRBA3233]|uniref:type VI secretion system lipoprotein TssJ n=1 Tax=Sulfitobacter marinivivus TaxID=3158558 RepID=UPI0032DF8C82